MKRITLITGHYGSGKTEFSVNRVIELKKIYDKTAILDMDIANPYFRSRERQKVLEDMGILVDFNSFGYDITEDLPAISASMRAPLENKEYVTIVDAGGNNSGAMILNQFKKYFMTEECEQLCVINANRPETDNLQGALKHIASIHAETGIGIDGLINNTHMLKDTKPEDIIKGYKLCSQIAEQLKIPVVFNVCHESLVESLKEAIKSQNISDMTIYPIKLYMRPTWLDR
ncbi:ATP-binding protein [Aminipila sp.]|uniref:ATP-binding protein n=1 Tax=Aminipila sp. TaxID=2060095 RepID=UPI00289F4B4F|nr:ATP-binding protein [Aminipila sp.]